MKVAYIEDVYENLTKGKVYEVILSEKLNEYPWTKELLLKNDVGEECWYVDNDFILNFVQAFDLWVKYIGDYDDLTNGKIYQLLKCADNEYYYIMNDNNKFIGTRKKDYFGGAELFEDVTTHINRINQIDNILHGEKGQIHR